MRLVAIIVGLFLAAVVFAVGSPQVYAETQTEQEQQSEQSSEKKYITVRSGDSLSKIAKREKTTYQRLYYANKQVKNPDLIYPGDELRVPNDNEELKERPLETVVKQVQQSATPAATQPVYKAYKTAPVATTKPAKVVGGSVWDKLAACESGGNWSINTGNGYYGGLQFSLPTWRSVGGAGYPHQNSKAEQIKRGQMLQARSGWGQWPACTAKLGLR